MRTARFRPPFAPLALAAALAAAAPAGAATFAVANEVQLRAALESANSAAGPHFINVTADITLTGALPPVLNSLTLDGNGHTLDGAGSQRLLVIGASQDAAGPRILVTIADLTLSNGLTTGGTGADGGGGGLGAGAAVLVNTRADVLLNNVEVVQNTASGGAGAAGLGGGGGGLGGAGGAGPAGGGGGYAGAGGAGSTAGGGGGALAAGGAGTADAGGGGGGIGAGGSGTTAVDGVAGSWALPWLSAGAGDGAGAGAGTGGSSGGGGGAAGAGSNAAGGGGGFLGSDAVATTGGEGGYLGGGGGGFAAGNGGDGGFLGGGGGSDAGSAGAGGFAGGGGGSNSGAAGDGGFGGGGGASVTGAGGSGGYGAGGGASTVAAGAAGVGGGTGSATGGGGGAGLGGAIFVVDGGSLTLAGSGLVSGNAVTAGSGAGTAGDGAAAGSGLFLQGSGNLNLRTISNIVGDAMVPRVLVLDDDIADAQGAGLAGASPFDRWNLVISGSGAAYLNGNNRYSGDTYINEATVYVSNDGNLGVGGGRVVLDAGALVLGNGLNLSRDIIVNEGGAEFQVNSVPAALSGNLTGTGTILKTGSGDLQLTTATDFDGAWWLNGGALVLDADSTLGNGSLTLNGGGVAFGAAFNDLRDITVAALGGTIDNRGHAIIYNSDLLGWTDDALVTFTGNGSITLNGAATGDGDTNILAGSVTGAIATGDLTIASGASYQLGAADRTLQSIAGDGNLVLGSRELTLNLDDDPEVPGVAFGGVISGTGSLLLSKQGPPPVNPFDPGEYKTVALSGTNTYSGGTRVEDGIILAVSGDNNLGSGALTLAGGGITTDAASSDIDIVLAGGGGIFTIGSDRTWTGQISGIGTLAKLGAGTLILDNDNTWIGNTLVSGFDSFIALAHPGALGTGQLQLADSGGLRLLVDTPNLLPIQLTGGNGVIDTGTHQAVSTGNITGVGDSGLIKIGSGLLTLTGTNLYSGLTSIDGGSLQIGNGGATGTLTGAVSIGNGASLIVNRSGTLTLNGDIDGPGGMTKRGTGLLALNGTNLFVGGLSIEDGFVAGASDLSLGVGFIVLDGGGLAYLSDIERDLQVASGGGELRVDAGSQEQGGDISGTGALVKSGAGRLVFTGVADHAGGTGVAAGTLQIGSGMAGVMLGNASVDDGATVAFGRDDLTLYAGVVSGAGNVEKTGAGELVLTGTNTYTGNTAVLQGNLRIGYGGTTGSIQGDVSLADDTALVFDRSDTAAFAGDVTGTGALVKNGAGSLVLLGDAVHAGGSTVNGGVLQVGAGGTTGSLSGDVHLLGTSRLLLARSDDLLVNGDLDGNGQLVQAGTGTTTLTGNNSLSGGVVISAGALAVDSDARLGSGALAMNGGVLQYGAAFDDLRSFTLGSGGGGLDTNGFDVGYSGLVSGESTFRKTGDGILTMTGILATNGVQVTGGEFRIGDGNTSGVLLGDVQVDAPAVFAFNRADDILFGNVFSGTGTLAQSGAGVLRLTGDSSAFAGTTQVNSGALRLDSVLGGNVSVMTGARLGGAGRIGGNLVLADGATLNTGVDIGALRVDGNATFGATSIWQVDVDADGNGDRLDVGGNATVDGQVSVLAGGGDYEVGVNYRILDAAVVTGTFDQIESDLVFLTPTLIYGADSVDLRLVRNGNAFVTVSLTYNQQAVAGALDRMDGTHPAVEYVQVLDVQGARDAYDAINGDSLLAGVSGSQRVAAMFSDRLRSRASRLGLASRGPVEDHFNAAMQGLRAGQTISLPLAAADDEPARPPSPVSRIDGLWLEVQQAQSTEQEDSVIGNAETQLDGQLLVLGFDGYWRDDLILGAALGMGQSTFDFGNRPASGDIDSLLLGAYGRWDAAARLQLKAALALGQNDVSQTRDDPVSAGTLASSATAQSLSVLVEAGVPMHLSAWGARPFVALAFGSADRDAFSEQPAAGSGALEVAATSASGGHFGFGVELSRPWLLGGGRWAEFESSAELRQPWGDAALEQRTGFVGTGEWYSVQSAPDDSATLVLALGMEAYLSRNLAVWGGYQGSFGGAVAEQGLLLSMTARW